MAKNLIILPQAEQDITEAYNWYQERELGLGEEFLRCIDASIQMIERNPEIYLFSLSSPISLCYFLRIL
jgi:plasmid stabilization system protein ParE